MSLKRHLLTITAAGGVALAGLAVAAPTHVFAGNGYSTTCNDNNPPAGWTGQYGVGDDIPLIGGPYGVGGTGAPMTLGVEASDANGTLHVALCYSTSPYNSTGGETTGDAIALDLLGAPSWSDPQGSTAQVSCNPDNNPQGVALSCLAATTPSYSVTGQPGTTGYAISVNIPFTVCFGGCTGSGAGVAPTGLFVGQLVPVPEPGIGFGYKVQSLQVYVNGALIANFPPITLAGAYINPFGLVEESLDVHSGGPCSAGFCVPAGYIGTTGANAAGFQILGIPVDLGGGYIPFTSIPTKQCLYYNPSTSYCP